MAEYPRVFRHVGFFFRLRCPGQGRKYEDARAAKAPAVMVAGRSAEISSRSSSPPAMVKATHTMLRDTGVDDDNIRTEEFAGYCGIG